MSKNLTFCHFYEILKKNVGKYEKQKSSQKNNDNMFDRLKKLNKLRLDGAITQEEFEQMKKKIIE